MTDHETSADEDADREIWERGMRGVRGGGPSIANLRWRRHGGCFTHLHKWQGRLGTRRKGFSLRPPIGSALCRWKRRAKLFKLRTEHQFSSWTAYRDPWEKFWIGPRTDR